MIKNLEGASTKWSIAFSSGDKCVTAKNDISGNISVSVEDINGYDEVYWKIINKLFVLLSFIIEMIVISKCRVISNIAYILVILKCIYSFYHLYHMSRTSFRNHGAEHMMINAYNKLKRVPTIEEAKYFSRFALNCGDRKYIINLICVIILIIFKFGIPYFSLRMAIYNLKIVKIISLPIQLFSTNIPDDSNLMLAREALLKLDEIMK
ncbi:MAG: DUF1385 domain-containing protein [Clostridia bacterium]|nr:DUF1385 domain-containing protein [Clostridia bacterium]